MTYLIDNGIILAQGMLLKYKAVPARDKDVVYMDEYIFAQLPRDLQALVTTIFIPTEVYCGPDLYPTVQRMYNGGRASDIIIRPTGIRVEPGEGKEGIEYHLRVHNVKGCGEYVPGTDGRTTFASNEWGAFNESKALNAVQEVWTHLRGRAYIEPVVTVLRIPDDYIIQSARCEHPDDHFVNMHRLFDTNVRDTALPHLHRDIRREDLQRAYADLQEAARTRAERGNAYARMIREYDILVEHFPGDNTTYLGMILDLSDITLRKVQKKKTGQQPFRYIHLEGDELLKIVQDDAERFANFVRDIQR